MGHSLAAAGRQAGPRTPEQGGDLAQAAARRGLRTRRLGEPVGRVPASPAAGWGHTRARGALLDPAVPTGVPAIT